MNSIAKFFTIYWIIYFPTCIAYNDLPSMGFVDEVMTAILIIYTFLKRNNWDTNPEPWKEFQAFLGILAFYIVYSLIRQVNVPEAVWLETVQQIRPFSIIYCTWILNPQFTEKQKKWMLTTMIATLASWIYYHPTTLYSQGAEFPVLGQLAICTGMAYYLFTEETKQNKYIAVILVLTGMLAPKFKFMGEVVCFLAVLFYVKERLNFKSGKTAVYMAILMTVVIIVTWERFDWYYVSGWENNELARPATYKASLKILVDYFPLGPGMGTFGTMGARDYYSPLLYEYNLNHIWGMTTDFRGFICDAFYPTLAQYGIVGVILFCIFWKRRLIALNEINDIRWYRVAFMTFFCLVIEQTADSSWLSGKGMGYCMLIGLCLNANRNFNENENEEGNENQNQNQNERSATIGDAFIAKRRKNQNENENGNDYKLHELNELNELEEVSGDNEILETNYNL